MAPIPNAVKNAAEKKHTLFIGNLSLRLPKHLLERELLYVFQQYGTPIDLHLRRDKRMAGTAHITFEETDEAARALEMLHGYEIAGMPMRIQWARQDSNAIKVHLGQSIAPKKAVEPETSAVQKSIFDAPGGPTAAVPAAATSRQASEASEARGTKRAREEEEESEQDSEGEAAMDVSDSE